VINRAFYRQGHEFNYSLDTTITIYLSTRSAEHALGNLLPIFSSVRLRFTAYGIVSCCCGRQGTTPYAVNLSLTLLNIAKDCPKHVELIL